MSEAEDNEEIKWKSLPALEGGVFAGMVTEVLDDNQIPNLVSTDLSSGGLGVVIGTSTVGKPWRIKVREEDYERALEIFESLMGNPAEGPPDNSEAN